MTAIFWHLFTYCFVLHHLRKRIGEDSLMQDFVVWIVYHGQYIVMAGTVLAFLPIRCTITLVVKSKIAATPEAIWKKLIEHRDYIRQIDGDDPLRPRTTVSSLQISEDPVIIEVVSDFGSEQQPNLQTYLIRTLINDFPRQYACRMEQTNAALFPLGDDNYDDFKLFTQDNYTLLVTTKRLQVRSLFQCGLFWSMLRILTRNEKMSRPAHILALACHPKTGF